jgi:hypothetical protein
VHSTFGSEIDYAMLVKLYGPRVSLCLKTGKPKMPV